MSRPKGSQNKLTLERKKLLENAAALLKRCEEDPNGALARLKTLIQIQFDRIAIDGEVEKKIGKLIPSLTMDISTCGQLLAILHKAELAILMAVPVPSADDLDDEESEGGTLHLAEFTKAAG